MVRHGNQHTLPSRSRQGWEEPLAEANKIGASTPYDFEGKNLTAYGGLLPVATMLALYVGFSRLSHLRFCGAGADAGRDLEGVALAAAVHLLAIAGLAASGDRPATVRSAAADAAAGVGSGARAVEVGHPGYRHHGAHAVWAPE